MVCLILGSVVVGLGSVVVRKSIRGNFPGGVSQEFENNRDGEGSCIVGGGVDCVEN